MQSIEQKAYELCAARKQKYHFQVIISSTDYQLLSITLFTPSNQQTVFIARAWSRTKLRVCIEIRTFDCT